MGKKKKKICKEILNWFIGEKEQLKLIFGGNTKSGLFNITYRNQQCV